MNEVYQESIELYEKYNTDLQDLKYKQGKLSNKQIIIAINKYQLGDYVTVINMVKKIVLLLYLKKITY